ncbi:MAG TPA: DUF4360 domain-containing protein [Pilimelia sp.]|nr:DUF4360 domain-containing protein [Pilimelia sp.]
MTIKRIMSSTGAAALLAGTALLGTSTTAAAATDDPADVPITATLVAANGAGCRAPDHGVEVKSFPTGVVQLNLPRMQAKAGLRNPPSANVACQVNLNVDVPAGYTWGLDAVGAKGFAYLAEGTSAKAFVSAYLTGQTATGTVTTELNGKYSGRWVQLDTPSAEITQACGEDRNLNVTTRVSANAGEDPKKKQAIMTLRSSGEDDHDVLLGLRPIKCDADQG